MTYSFDAQNISDIYKLGDFVFENKIEPTDTILINVPSKDPFEYKERVSRLFDYSFCLFIKSCRSGVNKNSTTTYIYPSDYKADDSDFGKYMGELLSLNTKLNIAIKHKPNTHEIILPVINSSDFRKEYHAIERYFIQHPAMPGDDVILKVAESTLDSLTQCVYYAIIGTVLNHTGKMFRIPALNFDLSENYFDECATEDSQLAHRLSKSGINFSIACI